MRRPLTFSWHRWEYPAGTHRRNLFCDRCGFCASHTVEPTAPEAEHDAASKSHVCAVPQYAWDAWRQEAFEAGMDPKTADVGRSLIREAHNHAWGVEPDLDGMLEDGLKHPRKAARRWRRILLERQEAELRGLR